MFVCFFGISQNEQDVEKLYLEYFKLPRESLYLHTNKTSYLLGDEIWFKAYAYDRKNNLTSLTTTNIYLGIYDEDGIQIDKKLYLAKDGMAYGSFPIDSTLASGDYYLKVSTNWMKNFKEDDSYIQKIQIINPKSGPPSKKEINATEYDFQFLPEGGHLVEDVRNTVGIKVMDDTGKGTECSGVIKNSEGQEVVKFKSNFLGLGKFTFMPQEGETYTSLVTLDSGKEFEQAVPVAEKIGISMTLNAVGSKNVIITLKTNESSLNRFKGKAFKLLVYKDGQVKSVPFVLNSLEKKMAIAKDELMYGTQTVTIFNEKNQPILERLFFNDANLVNHSLKLVKTRSNRDSISMTFTTTSVTDSLFASISVLPSETISYNPEHNISSALYLKPYVKGEIENPQYYFTNVSRKKRYELDILLLTQGWSRYSWDKVLNTPPIPHFDFENGITVNGYLNSSLKDFQSLFLYPTEQNPSKFIQVDSEGKFHLSNFYPEIGEEIKFSLMNKKGKMKRPGMSLSYINLMSRDQAETTTRTDFFSYYRDKNDIPNNFILDDSYEELDEIKLKADLRKKMWKESYDPILVNGKVTKITEEEINRYPNITDFIQDAGFDVIVWSSNNVRLTDPNSGEVITRRVGDVIITTRRQNRGSTSERAESPTIFLDGILVSDFNMLLNMNTDKVDKIVVDKTGAGLGLVGGFGGAIKIYTRKDLYPRNQVKYNDTYYSNYSYHGFEPIKEFYTPKYASYRMQSFKEYGIVHWLPDVEVVNGISKEFTMVNTGLDEIHFYIEGLDNFGRPFSQVLKYNPPKE